MTTNNLDNTNSILWTKFYRSKYHGTTKAVIVLFLTVTEIGDKLHILHMKESSIKWSKVVVISPKLDSMLEIKVLLIAQRKSKKSIVPVAFSYCSNF